MRRLAEFNKFAHFNLMLINSFCFVSSRINLKKNELYGISQSASVEILLYSFSKMCIPKEAPRDDDDEKEEDARQRVQQEENEDAQENDEVAVAAIGRFNPDQLAVVLARLDAALGEEEVQDDPDEEMAVLVVRRMNRLGMEAILGMMRDEIQRRLEEDEEEAAQNLLSVEIRRIYAEVMAEEEEARPESPSK
jgi:hypothetical protein